LRLRHISSLGKLETRSTKSETNSKHQIRNEKKRLGF
jgi:hypothetical protein